MKVVISTFYKGNTILPLISKINPNRIYLVYNLPKDGIVSASLDMIKTYIKEKEFVDIEVFAYELYDVAKKINDVIKKELDENNEIFICTTEGRKTVTLGTLLGASLNKNNIEENYYIIEESNSLITLPLFNLKISDGKREILQEIFNSKLEELKEKNDKSTLYVQLKELREDNYIDKENKITELGKIVLLE